MTFSEQLFPLFFLFLFPLRHALNPKNCSSSYSKPLRCGPLEVPIRFPFCDHPGFNLRCNDLNKTVLELPMSGTFLVQDIDYKNQQIHIKDPENCWAKRFPTFDISGSPFFHRYDMFYALLACPNEAVSSSWYPSVRCLSTSTSTFFATTNSALAKSMLPSCKIVEILHVRANSLFEERRFSSNLNNESLSLEWNSPDCKYCEVDKLRCGFKNKTSLEVKCLDVKKTDGHLSKKAMVIIICASIFGGVMIFSSVCIGWICCHRADDTESLDYLRRRVEAIEADLAQQPRGTMVRTGLDQSTIDSYKKMELGESKRVPGTNGIVCPICLSEYESKETVRFIPECNHCFHVECIDVWLKIHGSCPLCRSSRP